MYGFFEKETGPEKNWHWMTTAALGKFGEASWHNFNGYTKYGSRFTAKACPIHCQKYFTTHTHLQKSWQIIYSTYIFTVHLCGICFLQPTKNLRKPGTRSIS